MNKIDIAYQDLLKDILENGTRKETRNGQTISVFGRQIRHRMSEGFPLITTKKMHWKSIVTELLWFLRGDTNIKYLVENGCHIWDGDAYKNYLKGAERFGKKWQLTKEEFIERIKTDSEFAAKWGDLGPIYGKQWRAWAIDVPPADSPWHDASLPDYIDQIADVIHKLKTNPDDRGIIVSAWNVGELDQMVLRPCHYGFQVYTRELSFQERFKLWQNKYMPFSQHTKEDIAMFEKYTKEENEKIFIELNIPTRAISLIYNARSQDVPLGTPFNIASYALLLEIIAKEVNMAPDELIANMGDCHIYLNQKEGVVEQLTREPYPLPKLKILDRVVNDISEYTLDDIILENYQSHSTIKMPLSN
jgi:thymidylate synthase